MNTTSSAAAFQADVLVVGAGAAGVTAAIAAARNGARTVLVEECGFTGGLSAILPWLGFHDRDYRLVVKGLPLEFARRLQADDAAAPFEYDIKCGSAFSLDSHWWKCVSLQMCVEAGVRVLLQTRVLGVIREGERVAGVVLRDKGGERKIRAATVIDCTGDGDVAVMAGAEWFKGRTGDGLVQAPTLVFKLGGVDRTAFVEGCRRPELNYREWLAAYPDLKAKTLARLDRMRVIVCGGFAPLVEKARQAGDLDVPQTRIVGVKLHRPDEFLVVMTRVLGLDPTDGESLNAAYQQVYRQIPPLVRFFKNYVPGFAATALREIAPVLGVRESRRVSGEYMLTADDLIGGRVFEDSVAMGAYHIDIHRPSGTWVESHNVRAYTIPYRSLVARGLDGLLVAGKCFSATHEAVASTRVIPICMAQGQAAGTAAALASRAGRSVREVSVVELQDTLQQQGAEIGRSLEPPNQALIEDVGQLPLEEPPTTGDYDDVSNGMGAWLHQARRTNHV
jgi:glycine/D-amino acid oxidase-like deaminating enzyme